MGRRAVIPDEKDYRISRVRRLDLRIAIAVLSHQPSSNTRSQLNGWYHSQRSGRGGEISNTIQAFPDRLTIFRKIGILGVLQSLAVLSTAFSGHSLKRGWNLLLGTTSRSVNIGRFPNVNAHVVNRITNSRGIPALVKGNSGQGLEQRWHSCLSSTNGLFPWHHR